MKRIDVTRGPASTALHLGALAAALMPVGCSDSAATDKRDDPA